MQNLRQFSGREKAVVRGMACFPNFLLFCSFPCVSQLSQCLPTIFHFSLLLWTPLMLTLYFFFHSLSPHYFIIPGKTYLSVLSFLVPFNSLLRLFCCCYCSCSLFILSPLSLLILPKFKHCHSDCGVWHCGQQTSLSTEKTLCLMGID